MSEAQPSYRTPTRGVAATAFPAATDAALAMLRAGGNAVDAAVAAAWALGVCEPSNSGLGGQTTILLRRADGTTIVLDGHSVAPAAVSLETLSRRQQKWGHSATTIPTTPAMLDCARRRFGRLDRAATMAPAIALAEEGVRVTSLMRRQTIWCRKGLDASPTASELMLKNGALYNEGDLFRQPALASTLRRLAREGVEDFYRGQVARQIAEDMLAHGGMLTAEDLATVGDPVEKAPLRSAWQGQSVFTVAPPGGGLQVLLGLRLMEKLAKRRNLLTASDWYSMIGEATHSVFRLREELAIPLSELTSSRVEELLSDEHLAAIAEPILAWRPSHKLRTSHDLTLADAEEPGETTHLCTADAEGNVVSLTQSIQSLFGARAGSLKLGFLYNNYLLTCPREPHPFQLASGCQPRSNAAPTMVVGNPPDSSQGDKSATVLAIGAAGSRRITSAILQSLCGVQLRGLSLAQAISAPRMHVKQSRNLWLEQTPETAIIAAELAERFRRIDFRKAHSFVMGCVQAVQIDADGTLTGAADPRREGTAAVL